MLATVQKCVHTAPKYGTKPIRYVTLHFRERGGGAHLRFVTEMAPKSLFLCVNRSPIQGRSRTYLKDCFLLSWENNRDCHITMHLSLKTMEMQIKGDQWNKRFRTVQVYCYPVWSVFSVLTRISYTGVHRTHREAKRGPWVGKAGHSF